MKKKKQTIGTHVLLWEFYICSSVYEGVEFIYFILATISTEKKNETTEGVRERFIKYVFDLIQQLQANKE